MEAPASLEDVQAVFRSEVYRLAFELHKLPAEIYAMDATEFSEMLGYLDDLASRQKAATITPPEKKGRVPQTMG